jgi:hypothetical protein
MSRNTFGKASISGDYGQDILLTYLKRVRYEVKLILTAWDVKATRLG